MDKRVKSRDMEKENRLRRELFDGLVNNKFTIAEAVRRMHELSPLTQPEFAKHSGISLATLKQILRGTGNPTVESLNKIGAFFGVEAGFVPKKPKPPRVWP